MRRSVTYALHTALPFAVLASTLLSGCLGLEPPEGRLECASSAECPAEWACRANNRCYRTADLDASTADAGGDLGVTDLGMTDLGTLDLGMTDLGTLDLGMADLGAIDFGVTDLGTIDLGVTDLGTIDLGPPSLCETTPCGAGLGTCVDTASSYACSCNAGYMAPASGGTCEDVNECVFGTPCGLRATACTNTVGSYACTCNIGYAAPPGGGGPCADIDECAFDVCGANATSCVNSPGTYACSCAAGYTAPAAEGSCVDVNECATLATCGSARLGCTNTAGSYRCSCNAGYAAPATGGACADVDECVAGTSGCDARPGATCSNTVGGFVCGCTTGFVGDGVGVAGCRWNDPSLTSLSPSAGSLSPAFAGATTAYQLALPSGATSLTFTPSVTLPARAAITVNGVTVTSGAASVVVRVGFAPSPVTVVVTTESGAMRSYTVLVARTATYVKASNADGGDEFGRAIALSADGSTLAVGAIFEDSNATGIDGVTSLNWWDAGSVYVYSRVGTTWAQQAYIKASNTDPDDRFGRAIALSADGSTLAVGAIFEDSNARTVGGAQGDNSASNSGAVYVFTRTAGAWSQQAYVKASNADANDNFGSTVSLSADGAMLAVGAPGEDSNAMGVGGDDTNDVATDSGAVYVFTRAAGAWSQQAYVKTSNTDPADAFGGAGLSLSSDGSTLAVGAVAEASTATGIDGLQTNNGAPAAGAVYVFTHPASTWAQEAYIKASNTRAYTYFGNTGALALSSDGSTLAVGAQGENSDATGVGGNQTNVNALSSGAVYVFARVSGAWSQQAYIKPSNTAAADFFGYAVSLSSDGRTLAASALGEDSNATGVDGDQSNDLASYSGAVYVFTRPTTVWSQQSYIKASNTEANDFFGYFVSLSSDGSSLAVGASGEDSSATGIDGNRADNSSTQAGAVYVY